jgi:uncharacterized protein
MKIWFDITNTPQVHFLLAIMNGLSAKGEHEYLITTRDFSETVKLLKSKTEIPFDIIGGHHGKSLFRKASGLINRFSEVSKVVKEFDVSISCGSESAVWNSFVRNKKSIAFGDNDLAKQWTYGLFVSYAFFPKSIPTQVLTRQGIKKSKLYQYDGFKEQIYLADFVPDDKFTKSLPFEDYVVVRPENIKANYVSKSAEVSITPALLKKLSSMGENILYLPRYQDDFDYAKGISNVYIPPGPLNGIDACYFSKAVFTGAGTLAREAACLNIPSYSFFAGETLLAVDRDLIGQNKMMFSRDADELCRHYLKSEKKQADLSWAKLVKEEVMTRLMQVINK